MSANERFREEDQQKGVQAVEGGVEREWAGVRGLLVQMQKEVIIAIDVQFGSWGDTTGLIRALPKSWLSASLCC